MATAPKLEAAFPSGPLIDTGSGDVSPAWRAYFAQLYRRTGSGTGNAPGADTAALLLERSQRINGDADLSGALQAEATARENADTAETTARKNADTAETMARQNADALERTARQNADALLVPLAQLCSLWAACNLSFLPTTDPGNGMPWLDGNHIAIGTPTTSLVGLALEDATGLWQLEDGSGHWIWG